MERYRTEPARSQKPTSTLKPKSPFAAAGPGPVLRGLPKAMYAKTWFQLAAGTDVCPPSSFKNVPNDEAVQRTRLSPTRSVRPS
eukprot:5636805-Heterocapsa_arctica.AAC.1